MPTLMEANRSSRFDLLALDEDNEEDEDFSEGTFSADFAIMLLFLEVAFAMTLSELLLLLLSLDLFFTLLLFVLELGDGFFLEKKLKSVPCLVFGDDFFADPTIVFEKIIQDNTSECECLNQSINR